MFQPIEFTREKLFICEGPEDLALIKQMIREGLAPTADAVAISDLGEGNGIDALPQCLKSLPGVAGFANVTDLAIIADNDRDVQRDFDWVRNTIIEANCSSDVNRRYSVPNEPNLKDNSSPVSVIIIPLPDGVETGCLETLLLRVLDDLYQSEMQCVDALIQCAGLDSSESGWSSTKIAKAKVRTAIAIMHKKNPPLTLSLLWKKRPDLIPVSHSAFSDLSQALLTI